MFYTTARDSIFHSPPPHPATPPALTPRKPERVRRPHTRTRSPPHCTVAAFRRNRPKDQSFRAQQNGLALGSTPPPRPAPNVANIKERSAARLRFPPGCGLLGPRAGRGSAQVRGWRRPRDPASQSSAPAAHLCALYRPSRPPAPRGPLAELGSRSLQLPCPSPGQGQVRAWRV